MELMKQERPAEMDDDVQCCEACGEPLNEDGNCPYDDEDGDGE